MLGVWQPCLCGATNIPTVDFCWLRSQGGSFLAYTRTIRSLGSPPWSDARCNQNSFDVAVNDFDTKKYAHSPGQKKSIVEKHFKIFCSKYVAVKAIKYWKCISFVW